MANTTIGLPNDIWRTYYAAKSNVSEGSRIIVDYLFSKKNKNISKGTAKDAQLLTQFFQELKALSKNNLADVAEMTILGTTIKNMPVLNFTLGGNATNQNVEGSGGVLFEKEIEKLFEKSLNKITGSSAATSYIDLGTINEDTANKILKNIVKDVPDLTVEDLRKQIEQFSNKHYYLKSGKKRAGKIDIEGGEISFDIGINPTAKMQKVQRLLENSTFSIKSYETMGQIHLGDTNPQKAVSAVADYVSNLYGKPRVHIRGSAIYYLHHPIEGSDDTIKDNQRDREKELYRNYDLMKRVYELTGIGLRYSDLDELRSVDFLLVNRSQDKDITVYSVQDLLNRYDITAERLKPFDIK